MSSLWNFFSHAIAQIQVKENPSPMLLKLYNSLARGLKRVSFIKRIPLSNLSGNSKVYTGKAAEKGLVDGSMTVEAAVIIPLFLFFFVNLMSAIEMIRLHGNIQLALWEKGRSVAIGGYVYDAIYGDGAADGKESDAMWADMLLRLGGTLLSDYMLQNAVVNDLGREYLNESPLTYGEDGLVFLESSYMKNDCIDIKVTYQVSPVFAIPGFSSFRMANRYYARAWTGYQVDDGSGELKEEARVYVTEYGEVYHINRGCSYLVRNVKTLDISEVESVRNSSGARYQLCSVCGNKEQRVIFVTQEGSKYHCSRECPSLVRNVITMEREAAGEKYRPCSKCAA